MSLARHLQNLRHQRHAELAQLRTRCTAIAGTLHGDPSPAQWIASHPYLATTSAALLGFTAAQLAPSLRPAPAAPVPAPPPPAPQPADAASAPASSSLYAHLLPLLLNLAQSWLQPPSESPATITPTNANTLATPDFPHPFANPQADSPA